VGAGAATAGLATSLATLDAAVRETPTLTTRNVQSQRRCTLHTPQPISAEVRTPPPSDLPSRSERKQAGTSAASDM
jgi:hypothetical protein